jgi:hypothetical protein
MFGLPDITIIAVGTAVILIFIILILWGLYFKGDE